MSRQSRDNALFSVFAVVSIAALAWLVAESGHQQRAAGAVTVAAATPTPTPEPITPSTNFDAVDPDRARAAIVAALPKPPSVLTIRNGRRALTFPIETNWDAVEAHCARKLLAAITRELALSPEWERYRDARFGAAWNACPGFRIGGSK